MIGEGAHGVQRVDTIAASGTAVYEVPCPAGKVASGGGYFVDNPSVMVIKSYPGLAGYAWTVVATNPDSSDHSVTTWVLCVEGSAIDGGTYTPGP